MEGHVQIQILQQKPLNYLLYFHLEAPLYKGNNVLFLYYMG